MGRSLANEANSIRSKPFSNLYYAMSTPKFKANTFGGLFVFYLPKHKTLYPRNFESSESSLQKLRVLQANCGSGEKWNGKICPHI